MQWRERCLWPVLVGAVSEGLLLPPAGSRKALNSLSLPGSHFLDETRFLSKHLSLQVDEAVNRKRSLLLHSFLVAHLQE